MIRLALLLLGALRALVQRRSDLVLENSAQRQQVARGMRAESEQLKRSGRDYPDVDTATALQWLRAADAPVLVHGHTQKPGEHALDATHRRIVLSDWDAGARPPRLEALRLHVDGRSERVRLA